jgi:hypothetical protein
MDSLFDGSITQRMSCAADTPLSDASGEPTHVFLSRQNRQKKDSANGMALELHPAPRYYSTLSNLRWRRVSGLLSAWPNVCQQTHIRRVDSQSVRIARDDMSALAGTRISIFRNISITLKISAAFLHGPRTAGVEA